MPSKFKLSSLITILCATCIVALAHAQDKKLVPHPLPRFEERVGWHLVNGVWLQASGACEWADLIDLKWRDDDLGVDLAPAQKVAAMLSGHRHAAIEVGAAKDLYDATLRDLPPGAGGQSGRGRVLEIRALHERDHDGADGIDRVDHPKNDDESDLPPITAPLRPMLVVAAPDMVRINCRGQWRGAFVSISFISTGVSRNGRVVMLNVVIDDKNSDSQKSIQLRAASLARLIEQHPVESRRFLSPMFRMVRGENAPSLFGPGAADVYRAFSSINPSEETNRRVQPILSRMLDEDYRVRSAALDEMRSLGSAGICAVSRLKLEALAPQQRAFIEQILREQSRKRSGDLEAEALRQDPNFLIDCLEFPDVAVRAASIERLSPGNLSLEKLDPRDVAACDAAADDLRQ